MRAARREAAMWLTVAMLGLAFCPSALGETSPTGPARRSYPRPRAVLLAHKAGVNAIAFAPDGKTLASASADRSISLWDVASHRPLGSPLSGHADWVVSVAFAPDGRTLASASADRTVILWDVAAHRPVGPPLAGHQNWVSSV